jgi:hypothetical protein
LRHFVADAVGDRRLRQTLGKKRSARASYAGLWHKADMPHPATNVCFGRRADEFTICALLKELTPLPRSGIKPGLRLVSLESGNAEDEQRLWHNSPKNF